MNISDNLDFFDWIIIEHMSKDERLSKEKAKEIFISYKPVFESFGIYHRNADEYAELFVKAYFDGYTPDEWLEHIKKLQSEFD